MSIFPYEELCLDFNYGKKSILLADCMTISSKLLLIIDL
jgi:hypothetical protein